MYYGICNTFYLIDKFEWIAMSFMKESIGKQKCTKQEDYLYWKDL